MKFALTAQMKFSASQKVKLSVPPTPAGISHAVRRISRPKGISQILKGFISLKKGLHFCKPFFW
jgi:hypothetical protein